MTRIATAFARAAEEGRAAFVADLTAGDPSPDATVGLARALAASGADVLELGVPFSDPIADGPVLQRASSRALAGGTDLGSVFAMARTIRKETSLALILFSYLNPVLRRGAARTAADAREAGFDGALLTDLPPEEAAPVQPLFRDEGLDTVFLVSPTSPPSRMAAAARLSSGFLYVVSRPGTTGVRRSLPEDLAATVRRARTAAGRLPVAVGFGISDGPTAARAARLADGIIVGSAIMRAAEEAGDRREEAVSMLARRIAAACLGSSG
jgi:tryptophan synthase alpha chain